MNIQMIIVEDGTHKILIDKMTNVQLDSMRILLQTLFSHGQFENSSALVCDLSVDNVINGVVKNGDSNEQ